MKIIFCSDMLNPAAPDPDYAAEYAAAQAAGFVTELMRFDVLVDEADAIGAIRRLPAATEPTLALYRGWMIPTNHYHALQAVLQNKGYTLVTSGDAYAHTHELPQWYPLLEGHTPRSVWLPWDGTIEMERIMAALATLGDGPVILKDYVKSRKHEWATACYIPHASDRAAIEQVVTRFVELQGTQLAGGLVFRQFVNFAPIGTHPQSGMPLTKEYRLFIVEGQVLIVLPYWEGARYDANEELPLEQFRALATLIQSRFFTMDVAQADDGSWMIVELGDGQVAGLPDHADPTAFYRRLKIWADRMSVLAVQGLDAEAILEFDSDLQDGIDGADYAYERITNLIEDHNPNTPASSVLNQAKAALDRAQAELNNVRQIMQPLIDTARQEAEPHLYPSPTQ